MDFEACKFFGLWVLAFEVWQDPAAPKFGSAAIRFALSP
jgi:hypothetical protein